MNEGCCRFTDATQSKPELFLHQSFGGTFLPSLAMDAPASLLRHRLRNSAGSSGWEHTAAALDSVSWRLRPAEAWSSLRSVRRAFTDSSGKWKSPSCNKEHRLEAKPCTRAALSPVSSDLWRKCGSFGQAGSYRDSHSGGQRKQGEEEEDGDLHPAALCGVEQWTRAQQSESLRCVTGSGSRSRSVDEQQPVYDARKASDSRRKNNSHSRCHTDAADY